MSTKGWELEHVPPAGHIALCSADLADSLRIPCDTTCFLMSVVVDLPAVCATYDNSRQ